MPRPANHRRWSSRAATHADSSATAACDESARAMRGTPPASHRRDDRHGAAIAAVDGAAPQRVSPHPSRCAALRSTTRASIEGQKRSCGARSGAARSRRPTDERPRRDRERATGTSRCQRLPVNGAPRVIDRGHRVQFNDHAMRRSRGNAPRPPRSALEASSPKDARAGRCLLAPVARRILDAVGASQSDEARAGGSSRRRGHASARRSSRPARGARRR
jgi:hypothetical protein